MKNKKVMKTGDNNMYEKRKKYRTKLKTNKNLSSIV